MEPEFGAGLSVPEIIKEMDHMVRPYLDMPEDRDLDRDTAEHVWERERPVIERLCEISGNPPEGYRRYELGLWYGRYVIEWMRCQQEGILAYAITAGGRDDYAPDEGKHFWETPLQELHHGVWIGYRVFSTEIMMWAAETFVPPCPEPGGLSGDWELE